MTERQAFLRRQPDDARRLCDVPTWEGVLLYDPRDLAEDRPLRFYRRLRNRRFKAPVIYELKTYLEDVKNGLRKKGSYVVPMYRWRVHFMYKGKQYFTRCSCLTLLCLTGFAIADPRHWVVDHIDGDCTNDRPSNLQVISQRENLLRSPRFRENSRLSNQARRERAARLLRQAGIEPPTDKPKKQQS